MKRCGGQTWKLCGHRTFIKPADDKLCVVHIFTELCERLTVTSSIIYSNVGGKKHLKLQKHLKPSGKVNHDCNIAKTSSYIDNKGFALINPINGDYLHKSSMQRTPNRLYDIYFCSMCVRTIDF